MIQCIIWQGKQQQSQLAFGILENLLKIPHNYLANVQQNQIGLKNKVRTRKDQRFPALYV